jgi:hypothetical protein
MAKRKAVRDAEVAAIEWNVDANLTSLQPAAASVALATVRFLLPSVDGAIVDKAPATPRGFSAAYGE